MTYRIEFAPEKQRTIEAAAARLGVAVETFIARGAEALAQDTTQSTVETRTPVNARAAARLASFRAAVETSRRNNRVAGITAPLSDWALSRAGAYEDAREST
jgi:hypothetical protein